MIVEWELIQNFLEHGNIKLISYNCFLVPLFYLFIFKNFHWSIVDLQRCATFCCTAK